MKHKSKEMTENINITLLSKIPELFNKAVLEIQPLAPLSMVSELPGSYYKSLKIPNKKMVCGLFENLLGWHLSEADRKIIIKEIVALRKKQSKKQEGVEFVDRTKGSTYSPLLMDYFEIENVQSLFTKVVFYDDLWSKAFRRSDATGSTPTHAKGTTNIDYTLISKKGELPRDSKNEKQVDSAALGKFYGENKEKFPFFYSTPTNREFIAMEGKYIVQLGIDTNLLEWLMEKMSSNNLCYLGNSEGWVDLKLNKI